MRAGITITPLTQWKEVLNTARVTVGKADLDKEPSAEFKKRMIASEHSPLRALTFTITITGVKSWVATHLCRHGVGYEPFIRTQRGDRTGIDRDKLPQDAPVDMKITLNAQAFINVSQRRMCHESSKETREIWTRIIAKLAQIEPELAMACVPSCVYRGLCPESPSSPCTLKWQGWRKRYEDTLFPLDKVQGLT